MSRTTSFWDEPETMRLIGLDERAPSDDMFWRETEKVLRSLEREEDEKAADRIDELSAAWADSRGFPPEGFESMRYLTQRERDYKEWFRGDTADAARVRRVQGRA